MKKSLVAYFSASGTTASVAKTLAEAVGPISTKSNRGRPIPAPTWIGRTNSLGAAWK